MNVKRSLEISFSSKEIFLLLFSLLEIEPFSKKNPTIVTTVTSDNGFTRFNAGTDWIDKWVSKAKRHDVTAYWGYDFIGEYEEGFINYNPRDRVITIKISDYKLVSVENLITMFAPLPWTVANFYDVSDGDEDSEWDEYIAPGFIDGHGGHGWACAFKGEGHNHLVSRRWLEYHPWHLIRDEKHDISFVQFHDLDADPATALEQAKPGHRAMSMYGVGGYIGKTHPFSNDLRGVYLRGDRNLRVVIPAGKEITYSQMSDYCAARHFQAFEEGEIDLLSFVFIVANEAQPYIHDLWLREIECSGFTPKGEEIRLDEGYQPDYEPPQWVKKLQLLPQQPSRLEEAKLQLAQAEKKIENLNQRIKNVSGGKLTGELNQNLALISRIKELEKEQRKQRVAKQNLEREIAELENNSNS